MATIRIDKRSAARSNLEEAIILFFNSADPVAIHTLAAASLQVLRDLAKAEGVARSFVKDDLIETWVKEPHQKTVRDAVNRAENFFKHADHDHDQTLDFDPTLHELFLLDATMLFRALCGNTSKLCNAFEMWLIVNRPQMFKLPKEIESQMPERPGSLQHMPRTEFLRELLPLLHIQ